MKPDPLRRSLLFGALGLALNGSVLASRLALTPSQTAGPFYPPPPSLDDDNDLTRVRGASGLSEGRISDVSGRVLDPDGRPIAGARVEIWQCDARGRYHHPRDSGPAPDPHFQGFGHQMTDADGRYRFRTIRPVPYPGRTPHIHFAVFAPGAAGFATQLYVAGEASNEGDFVFRSIAPERRRLVMAEFVPTWGVRAELAARFDIVLAGSNGTPTI